VYYAKGLCASCYKTAWAKRNDFMYQKIWKARNSEKQAAYRRKANRKYYRANRGKIRRRQFLWEWRRRGIG